MGKSESKKVATTKVSKKESKKVEAPKAAAAVSSEKTSKKSKKSKKEPTPPPVESSSESESSDEESSEDEEDKVVAPAPASVTAPNGDFKASKAEESSSEESSSDDESDEEPSKAAQVKAAPAAKKDSDDESSEGESSDEETEKPAAAAKEAASSEESSDEDSSDEEEAAPVTNGKRKASEEAAAPTKKAKTENGAVAKTSTEQGDQEASPNVFVGSLSWNVDNDWLQSEFQECGEIVSVRIMMDREKNRSRGFGYIEFANLEAAAKAIELNGKEIDGRPVNINYASARPQAQNTEKRAQQFGDKQNPPCTTLWVGNMAFSSNEDSLYNAFGEYGAVQSVRMPTDRETGAPKGFAYVQFETVESAQAALDAWKGQELDGRALRLDFAPPRDNDGAGGGGGRGGRGGFGT
ncbi:hypothetical protein QFC22_000713 [Naganishia vaughanmartiniae]|uniref:Uncharacterized protein n=1 Tax=Naganishia vaughanmartiniae TaxID=1424756 RepID=A0ACC2XIY4_9TREE|nr:hypothetical protein QFC22_000713 [Naganishia vaughanmartiniae]